MTRFEATRIIDAPIEKVFKTVSETGDYSAALPHVIKCEVLSDIETGVGARFKETRVMGGKEEVTEVEITEYELNKRVRLVADSNGAIWDTVFTVFEVENGVFLKMVMDAKPYKLFTRVTTVLFKGMIGKSLEKDMDLFKSYCESPESKN